MTDSKITNEELQELFGPNMPMYAVEFLWGDAINHLTRAEIREQLQWFADTWRAEREREFKALVDQLHSDVPEQIALWKEELGL